MTSARWRSSRWLVLLFAALSPVVSLAEGRVLVLGRVSDNPAAHAEQLEPLLEFVVPRMADVGVTEGRILMAPNAAQMGSYLRNGRVDWVTETLATGLALQDRAGAVPLLLTERNGTARYRSVLFVSATSPIRDLSGLRGARLALQSGNSTSAYLLPLITLLDGGLAVDALPTPRDLPRGDKVGYLFANSEANIVSWVDKGLAEAGAISDVDMSRLARTRPEVFARLRVVGESPLVPRAIELVRGDLDPAVRERLRAVLLEAADSAEARPALRAFFGTTAFRPLDASARDAIDRLAEQAKQVRSQIE